MLIVPHDQDLFNKLCLYIAENGVCANGRYLSLYNDEKQEEIIVPITGTFPINGKTIEYEIIRNENVYEHGKHYMEFSLDSIDIHDIKIIKNFIFTNFSISDKVQIYTCSFGNWQLYTSKPKRQLASVFLPNEVDIYEDFTKFQSSKEIYDGLQISHSRIYLLKGIPGTGKTSLIHAVASEFGYSISVLEMGVFSDEHQVKIALKNLPSKTFLVCEDVDALFSGETGRETKNNISFSTVINLLDGLTSQNNVVVFLTTNHFRKLDPALIRRMDRIYNFTYATKDQLLDFNITEKQASFFVKQRTTVNIVQKFLLSGKEMNKFPQFNADYLNNDESHMYS